jgi:protein-tyrosine phosphatase
MSKAGRRRIGGQRAAMDIGDDRGPAATGLPSAGLPVVSVQAVQAETRWRPGPNGDPPTEPRTRPWSLLMVCTGNVCRSPMAERLALALLATAATGGGATGGDGGGGGTRPGSAIQAGTGPGRGPAVVISSAGVSAWTGETMQPNAARALVERGADPTGFRARQLTEQLVMGADLVLCATRAHRSAIVTLAPRALRRTFTLREFDRAAAGVTPERLVAAAVTAGGGLSGSPPGSQPGTVSETGPRGTPPGHADGADGADGAERAHHREVSASRLRAVGSQLAGIALTGRTRAAASREAAGWEDVADPLGGRLDAFRACAETISEALADPLLLLLAAAERLD